VKPKPRAKEKRGTTSNAAGKNRRGREHDLIIVAIGASAGGIEAFTDLIGSLPANTGMAFVLIQHLDTNHHSLLAELISKKTAMHVKEVTDGMTVEPNHVYVIPPNATMSISNQTLHLGPREECRL
jgi:two-component system CheB/CheR fusion protein